MGIYAGFGSNFWTIYEVMSPECYEESRQKELEMKMLSILDLFTMKTRNIRRINYSKPTHFWTIDFVKRALNILGQNSLRNDWKVCYKEKSTNNVFKCQEIRDVLRFLKE